MNFLGIFFFTIVLLLPFGSNEPNAAGFAEAESMGTDSTVAEIILHAGNSHDEKTRYRMLRNLLII